ncbi:MAG: M14 family metallopeptidase [Armatimonadota bacterium]|nr:M14 family metallopeptidase [Armatimonadota bacterium]
MDRSSLKILLLCDSPGTLKADLDLLYPERVSVVNFAEEPPGAEVLEEYTHVITAVQDGENLPGLDYTAVRGYAEAGGQVLSCLLEYAADRGWQFSKTHVGDRIEPAMRIQAECDVTRGYTVGDEVWWYGTVSSAPMQTYSNQMYQRQILNPIEDERTTVLGRSNVNQGAVMIEERVGEGRILALDLMSPGRPWYGSHGSENKWLFPGNFIGGSVGWGRHYPRRLCYDEFVGLMRRTAEAHEGLEMVAEGPCSDGREMYTLRWGDPGLPTVYLGGALHGWEWENCYGLVRVAELLGSDADLGIDAAALHWVMMPVQNPYGFDHFVRQNADGVDLNRNFDHGWADYPMPQDVAVPWDYNYKGTRAASARESRIIQGLIDDLAPIGMIDFHTAHYILMPAIGADEELVGRIHEDIQQRLKDRFVCQAPYNGDYQQVNMDRISDPVDEPYATCYAADRGCRAPILIEMSGNRDDVHGLVVVTDTVVEICMALAHHCAAAASEGS